MTEISWPDTLPVTLLMDGLSAKRKTSVVRTAMDAGPEKMRRRYTASVKTFSGKMLLNKNQLIELDLFFKTALADGVLRFNFTDPQTLETAEFRFIEPYQEVSVSGFFEISMSLERL